VEVGTNSAEYTIVVLNGIGWFLATRIARESAGLVRPIRVFGLLVLVYVAECIALSAGMGSNILGSGLAFLWGWILAAGRRGAIIAIRQTRGMVLRLSLYSCLPVASLLSVPIVAARHGWSVGSAEAGMRFGIPASVPSPINTIAGFFGAVVLLGIIGKVLITTGVARLLFRADGSARTSNANASNPCG
jgi:hypothetical protein